ncbi:MAG: TetR/AcrR family transcriptional regulator [Myxococcales bacterium]|nr:TetR/AcrR family transcriptional regulator [Myxococcales bacterium]
MPSVLSSRDKILDVGESLFARRGYAGVGMREVAQLSGLGKSSLFHHFRGKGQLYAEVRIRTLKRIRDALAPFLTLETAPLEALEEGMCALIDSFAEHPTSARLLLRGLVEEEIFSGESPPELEEAEQILAELLDDLSELIERGVKAGELRAVAVPDTMQSLIGLVAYHFASGAMGERILGEALFSSSAVRRRKREVVNFIREGLRAPRSDRDEEREDPT